MIQRIQSLFLLVSLCFLIPMFFVPVAEVIAESGDVFTFNLTGFYMEGVNGLEKIDSQYSLMAMGILICLLNLVAIFMYWRRVLQIRLCVYNMLLLVGLIGIMFYILLMIKNVDSISYKLPFTFPVIAIILHYLAFRSIRKDELMVRALDRLR